VLPFQALFVPALQQGKTLSHEFLIFHSYDREWLDDMLFPNKETSLFHCIHKIK
jgi:hypothetical protein